MYSNYTDVKMHIPNKTISSDEPPSINFVLRELREYAFHPRISGVPSIIAKRIIEVHRFDRDHGRGRIRFPFNVSRRDSRDRRALILVAFPQLFPPFLPSR